jgi:hypothetical protein
MRKEEAVTPFSLVDGYRRLGGTYALHLQCSVSSNASDNLHGDVNKRIYIYKLSS